MSLTMAEDQRKLAEQVERLQLKLDQMNSSINSMANAKSELSSQLIESEGEKLSASKAYIDMQMANNRLKEELEASRYELTNKIHSLEHDLNKTGQPMRDVEGLRLRNQQLEMEKNQLVEEYVNVKAHYNSLADELEREMARSDELAMELLNLLNSRAALREQSSSRRYQDEANALAKEEDRIRAVVHRLSNRNLDIKGYLERKGRSAWENQMFGEQRYREQIDSMKLEFSEGQLQMEAKMESKQKELSIARSLARERQQKISFLNARMITLNGEVEELKTANNRLQHKANDLNSEYKTRLAKYIEDISAHIDSSGARTDIGEESMAAFVNKMIKDLKVAHKTREEQLSQAAQRFKDRLDSTVKRHEEMLCAYRDLRAQVEARGLDDLDLGPDEHELTLSEPALQSSQQKEIVKLQTEVHSLKMQLKTEDSVDRNQVQKAAGFTKDNQRAPVTPTFANLSSWTSVRRQLRQFSERSLRQLEEERAALLTRNSILEEQLKENQDYIDKHLARYKEEINKLRQQLAAARKRRS